MAPSGHLYAWNGVAGMTDRRVVIVVHIFTNIFTLDIHPVKVTSSLNVRLHLGLHVGLPIYRPSLNFIMETTRSSSCTLWVVKTRLEWSWTTQLSLYFSSWIDSTYRSVVRECYCFEKTRPLETCDYWFLFIFCRLLKPRPRFSSCAASACTYPRISWPAGVWETLRITSAHTCLIRASSVTQPHRGKPYPAILPKPSEANWCTHLHLVPF